MVHSTSRCYQFDTFVRIASGCLMFARFATMPGRLSSILVRFAKHHGSTAGTHWTSCFWPRHAGLDGSKTWFRRTLWKETPGRAYFTSLHQLHQHLISPFDSFWFLSSFSLYACTCTIAPFTFPATCQTLPHLAPDLVAVLGPDVWGSSGWRRPPGAPDRHVNWIVRELHCNTHWNKLHKQLQYITMYYVQKCTYYNTIHYSAILHYITLPCTMVTYIIYCTIALIVYTAGLYYYIPTYYNMIVLPMVSIPAMRKITRNIDQRLVCVDCSLN